MHGFVDEFSPGNASSDDDEETIAKEEAEQSTDTKAEIAALQKESEMDLDDLDFLSDYLKNRDRIILSEVEHDDDEDTNQEAPKRSTSRKRGAITETKAAAADDESNVTFYIHNLYRPYIDGHKLMVTQC